MSLSKFLGPSFLELFLVISSRIGGRCQSHFVARFEIPGAFAIEGSIPLFRANEVDLALSCKEGRTGSCPWNSLAPWLDRSKALAA